MTGETITRGGKRPGAGRKKGLASIKAEEARSYTVKRIAEELEPILAAQIELAKGSCYEEIDGVEGVRRVFKRLPDPRVASFLINQLIGRPKETAEVKIEGGFSLIALAKRAEETRNKNVRFLESSVL